MHRSSPAFFSATFGVGFFLALLLSACSQAAALRDTPLAQVHFDERGGEAWTFTRVLSGSAEACEKVELSRGPVRLEAPVIDGRFRAAVPLAPGRNVVLAACAEAPSEPSHVVFHVRLPDTPRAQVEASIRGETLLLDARSSSPNGGTHAPLESVHWSADPSNPAPLFTIDGRALSEAGDEVLTLDTPAADGRYTIWLTVRDANGRRDRAGLAFVVEEGRLRLVDREHEPPSWMDEAVVYGVVPPLFGEPAFEAVGKRLSALAELGVTTLWFSPIFESPEGDFGYAVTDYFDVRKQWGTRAAFRALVERAHELGMKVVLDFVPNHTSIEHRYFRDAAEHGAASSYWHFYDRDEDGQPTHYFNWSHLPNLDYDNPEVRLWMLEAFSYWARELDVDGFRVDVAWGVIERAPDFFAELRRELVRIEPDVLLLAEASARDPRSYEAFDAAYDWTDELGQWAWHDVFERGRVDVSALAAALDATPPRVFRFLDNNDTGARFHSRHGEPLERVASTLLFTLPGIPGLFTGQEVGADYEPYRHAGPLSFAPDPARFTHYRSLARLRREERAFRTGRFIPLDVVGESSADVYAFARLSDEPDARPVVVVLGFGHEARDARIRLTPELASALEGRRAAVLFGKREAPRLSSDELTVHLGPHDARIVAFD